MSNIDSEIVKKIQELGISQPAALHEPRFSEHEEELVLDCVKSGWVSSVGKYVDEFEERLSQLTRHSTVACVNGTSALQVACRVSGVTKDSEVFIPTLTFAGSANAISLNGAFPHFVDTNPNTLSIDVAKLREHIDSNFEFDGRTLINKSTGRSVSAIMCVHLLGHIPDLSDLVNLCQDFNLNLIEDAAQALGSTFNDKHSGSWGKTAALSFNGNKIITTGGGGALVSRRPEIAKKAKHLTTTAKVSVPYHFSHDEIGYNFRLPNLNAALGCAQLQRLDEYIDKKRKLAAAYREVFSSLKALEFLNEPKGCRSNYWLISFRLKNSNIELLDRVLKSVNEEGFSIRPLYDPLHLQPMHRQASRMQDLSGAQELFESILCFPSSPFLWREQ